MKPLKIKLKDHHADNDQRSAIKTIQEHYDLSVENATIIIETSWSLNDEEFSKLVMTYLEDKFKKKEIKHYYVKEDMLEAFKFGTTLPVTEIEMHGEEVIFNDWLDKYTKGHG